jgi:hypothetical protein
MTNQPVELYQEYRTCPHCSAYLPELLVEERTRILDNVRTINHLIWRGSFNPNNTWECICPHCSGIFHTCHLHFLKRHRGQKQDCDLQCLGNSCNDTDYAIDFLYDDESKFVEEMVWELTGSGANFSPQDLEAIQSAIPIPASTEHDVKYWLSADDSYMLVFWNKSINDLNTLDERWQFKRILLPGDIVPNILNLCLDFSSHNLFRQVNELQTYIRYTTRRYV